MHTSSSCSNEKKYTSTECEMLQEELGAQAVLVEADELLEGGREGTAVVLEE